MATAMRDGDIEAFVTDPLVIAFKSLVGIEFTANAIVDAWEGKDQYGEPLYDPDAGFGERSIASLKYLFKSLGPTLITQQGGNIIKANASAINETLDSIGLGDLAVEGATKGREFSNKNEVMALVGLRTHTDATPRVLSRIARTELSDSSRDIGKVKTLLSSTDKVPDAQIKEYVNEALDAAYKKKGRIARASDMLVSKGIDDAIIADALETGDVKQSDIRSYLKGEVPDWNPSKRTFTNMRESMKQYGVPADVANHRLKVFRQSINEYNHARQ